MADLFTKVFNYKYLSKKDLKGFTSYKYSAIDTSPLSKYLMHPFWNFSVKFIPANIAPNLITFVGFLCMVVDVILLFIFDYDATSAGKPPGYTGEGYHMPDWILTLCGVLLFLAYNLDGVDGKQARKIGVSGPIGEMFDHGLDSYVVFFIPFCLTSVFGRDELSLPIFRGFLVIMSVTLNFYVSHCEKYNTGTLYLPWGYDLSMWVSSAIFIIAGVYGPSCFKFYVYEGVTFMQVFEVVIHATGLLTTLPIAIYNVYLSRQNRSGKRWSLIEAVRPVWSMLVMNVLIVYWGLKSTNSIVEYDPKAFMFLYGTLFSDISSRLIVAEMSGQRCELVCWLNWPLAAGVAVSLYHPQFEVSILYSLVFLSLLAHIHYGVCVVRQMCSHYKVNCFTVPNKRKGK